MIYSNIKHISYSTFEPNSSSVAQLNIDNLVPIRLPLRLGYNAQDHHIDRCSMFDLCRPLLIGTSSRKKKKSLGWWYLVALPEEG